jgi:hypothetical protein
MPLSDFSHSGGTWKTWTPTFTGVTLGGTYSFEYLNRDNEIVYVKFGLDSGTWAGGAVQATLPVPAYAVDSVAQVAFQAKDGNGTQIYLAVITTVGATDTSHVQLCGSIDSGGNLINNWTAGSDGLFAVYFFYRPAAAS